MAATIPTAAANNNPCPLCGQADGEHFFTDRKRSYHRCPHCALVFVPRCFWLNREQERAEYDRHENDPADPGYRRFLTRLADPLMARLAPASCGLDFGCGPGPALARMLAEKGFATACYDPFYADQPEALQKRYDFICATEVVEHLRKPDAAFNALFAMLKSGGWLGLMTKLVIDRQAFETWHYIRDATHICFYSRETFGWLAQRFGARLEFAADDVILMQKSEAHRPAGFDTSQKPGDP